MCAEAGEVLIRRQTFANNGLGMLVTTHTHTRTHTHCPKRGIKISEKCEHNFPHFSDDKTQTLRSFLKARGHWKKRFHIWKPTAFRFITQKERGGAEDSSSQLWKHHPLRYIQLHESTFGNLGVTGYLCWCCYARFVGTLSTCENEDGSPCGRGTELPEPTNTGKHSS